MNATVPATTLTADTASAACGANAVAITAVTSGPRMKMSSISTESSA